MNTVLKVLIAIVAVSVLFTAGFALIGALVGATFSITGAIIGALFAVVRAAFRIITNPLVLILIVSVLLAGRYRRKHAQ